MDQQQLRAIESRCIQEEPPFCAAACPIHVDVRALTAALGKGDLREARRVLDRTMPFADIVGRLCDHPCEDCCIRGQIGEPIAIGALERFCVSRQPAVLKPPKLPTKGGRILVLGAGLSAMVAALDLCRKGRPATLISGADGLGGTLAGFPQALLPSRTLVDAQSQLTGYGAVLRLSETLDQATLGRLIAEHDAVYIDFDEFAAHQLPFISTPPDPVTLALGMGGCFGGGGTSNATKNYSVIRQVEDGRRAALSIERFLQKVSLTAQRDKEGAHATRLITETRYYAPEARRRPVDSEAGYAEDEARAEAGRCIQCECMECVKQCVYLREFKEYPKTFARKVYNNLAIVQGTRKANRMINSCSLCNQCTVICPHDFPMTQLCRTTRATLVENGHMPPSAHDFALEDMRFSLSDLCRLSRHQPGTSTSRFVFYPGCQLTGSAPEIVRRVYAYLTSQLPGGVGLMLGCCGIPAHWAGQDASFHSISASFTDDVQQLGKPTVITACTSCLSIFKKFAPQVESVSLWQVLDSLELPQAARPLPQIPLTLHDPCTARHQPELRQSVRSLCAKLGLVVSEIEYSGQLADCCGWGGLMQMANPLLGEQAARVKAERGLTDGLAYCAMCRDNLAASGARVAHLLEYLFADCSNGDPLDRANPGFSSRHENRARLKRAFLADLWQEASPEGEKEEALRLVINPEVRQLLEFRRILDTDLRRVLYQAETSGRYLFNPENRHRLASLRPVRVTYWVEYEPDESGLVIHNAYSHRMQLPETP